MKDEKACYIEVHLEIQGPVTIQVGNKLVEQNQWALPVLWEKGVQYWH